MTSRTAIEEFLSQRTIAVVGVSRGGKKFGNAAFRTLRAQGYSLYPVNARAETIEGVQCFPSLSDLPEKVGGVLISVPPPETERVVREAVTCGIMHIWMQQGAESPEAIRFCQEHGITLVHGQCILMFSKPTAFPHRVHRFIWRVVGKVPA